MGKKKRGQNPRTSETRYEDVNNYDVSDSEGDMEDGDKMLLEKVRSLSKSKLNKQPVALMDIPSSEESDDCDDRAEEDEVDGDEDDMKSDIEGQGSDDDDMIDEKAWGKNKKNYYNTDYIDADYGGFDGEDAEAADMEEQEAREIQKRLTAELEGVDYSLDLFTKKTSTKQDVQQETDIQETVKTDLSLLTSREKLNLLMKEAPELPVIAEEFQSMMLNVLRRLQKADALVQNGQIKSESLKLYIRSKLDLSLNYAINVVFYLNLRARRIPVTSHPVVRRLLQYRDLLEKLKPLEDVAEKQIDNVLELEAAGKLPAASKLEPQKKPKTKLDLVAILKEQKDKKLKKDEKKKRKKEVSVTWEEDILAGGGGGGRGKKDAGGADEDSDDDIELPLPKEEGKEEETDEKRAITWQIAKNKGLTPRRKKEQRNPRVKHRNRFRKAKIRRKGQIREVRNEIQKYGGEMSGIKSTVTKSIKFS